MAGVDTQVVKMQFDNAQFEKGGEETLIFSIIFKHLLRHTNDQVRNSFSGLTQRSSRTLRVRIKWDLL